MAPSAKVDRITISHYERVLSVIEFRPHIINGARSCHIRVLSQNLVQMSRECLNIRCMYACNGHDYTWVCLYFLILRRRRVCRGGLRAKYTPLYPISAGLASRIIASGHFIALRTWNFHPWHASRALSLINAVKSPCFTANCLLIKLECNFISFLWFHWTNPCDNIYAEHTYIRTNVCMHLC